MAHRNSDTALSTTEAAIEVYRNLLRASSNVGHDDAEMLVTCRRNASTIQSHLGRHQDALASAEAAVALCREYPNPVNLASCLNTLAVKYRALGCLDDALGTLDEAASTIWFEFVSNPQQLAERLEIILRNLWEWHEEAGRSPPAALRDRVEAFRVLSEHRHGPPSNVGDEATNEGDLAARLLVAVAQIALREKALGNDNTVVRWWSQLAELLLGLAWRVRGWHVNISNQNESGVSHYLVVLPRDSPELVPLRAMQNACTVLSGLADGTASSPRALDELDKALRVASQEDPLIRAAHALETAGRAGELTLQLVHDVTQALLSAVRATAKAMEASRPQERDATYVGDVEGHPIPGPWSPTAGEEMRVLWHVVDVTSRHFDTRIML